MTGGMQCLLPGIFSCCLLFLHIVSGVVRLEDERSSFVSLKHDTCLRGHIIQTKKASSLMICAQYCLTNGKCKSVNFRKKGICELNDASPEESHVHDDVKCQGEVTLGWLVRYTTQAYVFTSLNGQGMNGPTSTDGYRRTSLQGTVTITNGSIQYWVTPEPGNYVIEAVGASGANGTCSNSGCSGWSLGGKGAKIKGSFALKKGTRLKILVGQQGVVRTDTPDAPGGGGGGTFVSLDDNTPLIVAGGGGGGGITSSGRRLDGDPGQTSTNGSRYGGADGNGGLLYDWTSKSLTKVGQGTAGSGFYKEGDHSFFGTAAKSFIDGGTGGAGNSNGGFGGGGFAIAKSPGGGGGYSGGGVIIDSTNGGSAGGGGSFNSGTEQDNESGVNTGDGRVSIILSK